MRLSASLSYIKRNHFHMHFFALSLPLKQRFGATQKWPVSLSMMMITISGMIMRGGKAGG